MATPSRTGFNLLDASAGNLSTSATVPTDTNLVVASWAHWDGSAGSTVSSLSINGVAFTIISQVGDNVLATDSVGVGIAVLVNPAIGSQTHALNWSAGGARDEGGWVAFVYYEDGNTSDPYRVAGIDADNSYNSSSVTLNGIVSTDRVVGFTQNYIFGGTPNINSLGTSITSGSFNSEAYSVEEDTGLSGNITFTATNAYYQSLVVIALKESTGSTQSYTPTPSGGIAFDGAGTPARGTIPAPTSGIAFAGTGTLTRGFAAPTPTDGILFAGESPWSKGVAQSPSGGLVFDGAVTDLLRGVVTAPTGEILFAGAGDVSSSGLQSFTASPSGGIAFDGLATLLRGSIILPDGGIVFAGEGSVLRGIAIAPDGTLTFAGTGEVVRQVIFAPDGQLEFAGAADWSTVGNASFTASPSGGVLFAGEAIPLRVVQITATGGIVFEGAAFQSAGGPFVPGEYKKVRRHFRTKMAP